MMVVVRANTVSIARAHMLPVTCVNIQVIMLYASDRFGYYSNGVFACTTAETKTPLNHAMLVVCQRLVIGYVYPRPTHHSVSCVIALRPPIQVGWAPASGTTPAHWIVKNSWDTWWGEQGYIRIHMGIYKDCGISRTYAFRATIYS